MLLDYAFKLGHELFVGIEDESILRTHSVDAYADNAFAVLEPVLVIEPRTHIGAVLANVKIGQHGHCYTSFAAFSISS